MFFRPAAAKHLLLGERTQRLYAVVCREMGREKGKSWYWTYQLRQCPVCHQKILQRGSSLREDTLHDSVVACKGCRISVACAKCHGLCVDSLSILMELIEPLADSPDPRERKCDTCESPRARLFAVQIHYSCVCDNDM